jgi:hypothetical protein
MPDPQASPGYSLVPVDHDPFSPPAGVSMDGDLSSLDPYETIKLRAGIVNRGGYSPDQASANRRQTLTDIGYITPVVGNVMSAMDVPHYASEWARAARTGDPQAARKAAIMAELSTLGAVTGLPFGETARTAAEMGPSATRIFAGPMAKTANHVALSRAAEMEAQGQHPDEIWRATGWGRGADDKWRFEISDDAARVDLPAHAEMRPGELPVETTHGEAIQHPELAAAYPDIPERPLLYQRLDPAPGGRFARGTYYPDMDVFRLNVIPSHAYAPLSTGLHETQHGVQMREGFARGGAPGDFPHIVEQDVNDGRIVAALIARGRQPSEAAAELKRLTGRQATPQIMDIAMSPDVFTRPWSARDAYRRLAGEVEARNVQSRMDMTPEQRRASPPWETEDVPREQQIVRQR